MEEQVQEKKRSGLLTTLLVLTFISSGLATLGSLFGAVAFGTLAGMIENVPGMEAIAGAGTGYFIVSLVLSGASLFGAIKMWGLKKMGFYIYTIAQVLMIIVPLFFSMPFSAFSTIITALFIVLYFINLKHMD